MHSEAEALEHTKKRDTGHQSVSLENKTGDSTVLKLGNSGKVVRRQRRKGWWMMKLATNINCMKS